MTSDAKKSYIRELGHKNPSEPRNKSHQQAHARRDAMVDVPEISQRLFNSITRQPLQANTRLRDGEDDVDEAWRISKQIDSLVAKHNISDTTKDYMKKWNSFMMRLKLSSNFYLAEALVQFVTNEKEWFAGQRERIREFTLHANVLRLRGTIKVDCILDCLSIMRDTRTSSSEINKRRGENKEQWPKQATVLDTSERLSEHRAEVRTGCLLQ